jgi:hypothetical protein
VRAGSTHLRDADSRYQGFTCRYCEQTTGLYIEGYFEAIVATHSVPREPTSAALARSVAIRINGTPRLFVMAVARPPHGRERYYSLETAFRTFAGSDLCTEARIEPERFRDAGLVLPMPSSRSRNPALSFRSPVSRIGFGSRIQSSL